MKHFNIPVRNICVFALVSASLVGTAWAQTGTTQIKGSQENRPVWDKSSSFGPVPPDLQKIGDAECQKAKYDRAVGYAPKARSGNGSDFEKGGFLCEHNPKSPGKP